MIRSEKASDKRTVTAVVSNIKDPEKRGRFKVRCTEITGDSDEELPDPVEIQLDKGWFQIPSVGQKVVLHYLHSSEQDEFYGASATSMTLVWKGEVIFTQGQDKSNKIDERFVGDYPNKSGFVTKSGHIILFNDKSGSEEIVISKARNKNNKTSSISLGPDGGVVAEDEAGNTIALDAQSNEIKAVHSSGLSTATIKGDSIDVKSTNTTVDGTAASTLKSTSGVATVSGATVTLAATVTLNITSNATVVIDAPDIQLTEGAVNAVLKSPAFATFFDGHIHSGVTTGPGASGPPVVPMTPTLSTLVNPKVKV